VCDGKRFTEAVLEYRLRGKNIAEVLEMPVSEALEFFADGPAHATLQRLSDVGLQYLGLGQALNTLSGGERQRLKLAIQMAKNGHIYILDEPTTGLHLADVDHLLALLDRLVDDGNTVIVIEHHQAVMAHADWIIDLGPGAGHDGGTVVFEGTPAALIADGTTLTAQHLKQYVSSPDAMGHGGRTDVAHKPIFRRPSTKRRALPRPNSLHRGLRHDQCRRPATQ